MADRHPDHLTLEGLLLERLGVPERRRALKHLMIGCRTCHKALDELRRKMPCPGSLSRPGSWWSASQQFSYDEPIDGVVLRVREVAAQMDYEREQADGLVARLLEQPQSRREWIVRNGRGYQTWSVCEGLLDQVWDRRFNEPQEALRVAELAIVVAETIDPERYGASLVEDLRGRTWSFLANARRVMADLRGAEQAFRNAESHLACGTGNPLEQASLLDLRSSLESGLERWPEAVRLIDSAIGVYRATGQSHALGRALIKKGMLSGYQDAWEEEIRLVREGLELIDVEADPPLVIAAWHNLIYALHVKSEDREALALLARARPLYLRFAQRSHLISFQWLEGTIALSLDRCEQAEGCLREVRRSFLEEGIATKAALVSLDLSGLLAKQGRYSEVRQLAVEMIALFESRGMTASALASLHLLQRAAERERITAALLERVSKSVQRAEPAVKA